MGIPRRRVLPSLPSIVVPSLAIAFPFALAAASLGACNDGPLPMTPAEIAAEREAGVSPASTVPVATVAAAPSAEPSAPPPGHDDPATVVPDLAPPPAPADDLGTTDPTKGSFDLAAATAGMAPTGALYARIKTSKGDMECKLYDDRAPKTVANFVGLARGTRPFKDPKTGKWVKRPIYDGTTFHRIIKGFMIQGGDPLGNGTGEPGYVIDDEIWPGSRHDRAGLLCMANRGKNTNGAQFFITDKEATFLDGNYTIFGSCSPVDVIHAIANVEMADRERGAPKTPVTIDKVTIERRASGAGGAGSGGASGAGSVGEKIAPKAPAGPPHVEGSSKAAVPASPSAPAVPPAPSAKVPAAPAPPSKGSASPAPSKAPGAQDSR